MIDIRVSLSVALAGPYTINEKRYSKAGNIRAHLSKDVVVSPQRKVAAAWFWLAMNGPVALRLQQPSSGQSHFELHSQLYLKPGLALLTDQYPTFKQLACFCHQKSLMFG